MKRSNDVTKYLALLRDGKIGLIPCDTIWGVVGILNEQTVRGIREIKHRKDDHAFLLLVSDTDQLNVVTKKITESHRTFMEAFWPGPLTLVFEKSDVVSGVITGGKTTVAVRMPADPTLCQFISELGCPLISTSANISGQRPPVRFSEIAEEIKNRVDFVMPGDDPSGVASTILDLTQGAPILLREGAITRAQLQGVMPVMPLR